MYVCLCVYVCAWSFLCVDFDFLQFDHGAVPTVSCLTNESCGIPNIPHWYTEKTNNQGYWLLHRIVLWSQLYFLSTLKGQWTKSITFPLLKAHLLSLDNGYQGLWCPGVLFYRQPINTWDQRPQMYVATVENDSCVAGKQFSRCLVGCVSI